MATSTDFSNLWEGYQKEGVPAQISITQFCQLNVVVYKHFESWYKRRRDGVIPVEVVSSGSSASDAGLALVNDRSGVSVLSSKVKRLEIVFSSGLVVQHTHLDYAGLKNLVEKLSTLC